MLFYISLTMREIFPSFHLTLGLEDFFFCPVIGTFFYCLLDINGYIAPKCYG